MGKANRKMKKKQQKQQSQVLTTHKNPVLEESIRQAMADEDYSQVIDVLAKLIQDKDVKTEFMYDGAYAYFMLGDYQRAASWIDNTLKYDPKHIQVRILLARLCILEDRTDDGLAVLDYVLDKGMTQLCEKEKEELRNLLDYYGTTEREKISQKFPHIWAFLDAASSAVASEQADVPVQEAHVPYTEAALNQENSLVVQQIESVMQQTAGLAAKVRALNQGAGGYYIQGNLDAAEDMLKAALRIDTSNQESLHNMVVLQNELGNKEKALQYAAQLNHTDFLLLRSIRD